MESSLGDQGGNRDSEEEAAVLVHLGVNGSLNQVTVRMVRFWLLRR